MSTEDLKKNEDLQPEKAESVTESQETDVQAEPAGSADVSVTGFIEEYTGMTDTMVTGKTSMSDTMVADRTSVRDTMVADKTSMTDTMVSDRTSVSNTIIADRTLISNTIVAEKKTDTHSGGAAEEKKGLDASAETDPETEAIKEKIRERKREKIRRARARRIRFWTILAILLIAIAAGAFSLSGFFTVDSIEVKGNNHFTAEEIINIAHAVPGHNIIYDPGTQEMIDYLEQNPYIKQADVTRKFPSTLIITVSEREQACGFRYDDDYLIMDDEGILLKKTRTEPKITMIDGFVVSKIKLGEIIGTQNQKMFSNTLQLIRSMKAADMYFVSLDMTGYEDDGSVRAYIYDSLVVRSSYKNLVESLDNGRLHKVVEKLFDDEIKRGTITIGYDGDISFEPGI